MSQRENLENKLRLINYSIQENDRKLSILLDTKKNLANAKKETEKALKKCSK